MESVRSATRSAVIAQRDAVTSPDLLKVAILRLHLVTGRAQSDIRAWLGTLDAATVTCDECRWTATRAGTWYAELALAAHEDWNH